MINHVPGFLLAVSTILLHVAVVRFGAGARGPQIVERPAAGAFDGQVKGVALTEFTPAMGTADVRVFVGLSHGYGCCCAPASGLIAFTGSRHCEQTQADTLHGRANPVWGRGGPSQARRWGRANAPASALKNYLPKNRLSIPYD